MYKMSIDNFEFLRDMFCMNYGTRHDLILLFNSTYRDNYVEINEEYALQLLKYINEMIKRPVGFLETYLRDESWIANNPTYLDTLKQIKKELKN